MFNYSYQWHSDAYNVLDYGHEWRNWIAVEEIYSSVIAALFALDTSLILPYF